mmetsp:Transcript_9898/g.26104  ORF Transcript_9898/g.26104 Transcript_9898/m.26104 type:complete len:210 (+) Transcript_9898:1008-1637(+)
MLQSHRRQLVSGDQALAGQGVQRGLREAQLLEAFAECPLHGDPSERREGHQGRGSGLAAHSALDLGGRRQSRALAGQGLVQQERRAPGSLGPGRPATLRRRRCLLCGAPPLRARGLAVHLFAVPRGRHRHRQRQWPRPVPARALLGAGLECVRAVGRDDVPAEPGDLAWTSRDVHADVQHGPAGAVRLGQERPPVVQGRRPSGSAAAER